MKVKLLVQIGIVFGICLVGEGIAAVLPFTFPASVLSMLLLFVLLLCGVLKVEHIREKGDFLLKNMAFFFIPSGVALLEQVDFLKGKIMILLLICLITMVLTFAATAFTVRLVSPLAEASEKGGMLNGCRFFFPAVWNCSVHLYL